MTFEDRKQLQDRIRWHREQAKWHADQAKNLTGQIPVPGGIAQRNTNQRSDKR